MRVEVRLYSYHDMDLAYLYKTGRLSFPETTRQVLNAYAAGQAFRVRLLPESRKEPGKYHRFFHFYVNLKEGRDAGAIRLLGDITKGCRNSFIKTVLRQYLCGPVPAGYSESGGNSLFLSMPEAFQKQIGAREIRGLTGGGFRAGRNAAPPVSPAYKPGKENPEDNPSKPERKEKKHPGTSRGIPAGKETIPLPALPEPERVSEAPGSDDMKNTDSNPENKSGHEPENNADDNVDNLLTEMMEEY